MKKFLIALLASFLLYPISLDAKVYKKKHLTENPNLPPRSPSLSYLNVYIDEETGDMVICPNCNVIDLNITITGNGVTYLNTTVSLSYGQSYTDCLDYLGVGTYILTLSTVDGVIDQYEITVEDD